MYSTMYNVVSSFRFKETHVVYLIFQHFIIISTILTLSNLFCIHLCKLFLLKYPPSGC